MAADYLYMGLFIIIGAIFVWLTLFFCWLIRPHKPTQEKYTTYECGEEPIGEAFSQYNVRYYLYALVFVIFDVECIFLYPWGLIYKAGSSIFLLSEMIVFLGILIFGLIYAWRKGCLRWL